MKYLIVSVLTVSAYCSALMSFQVSNITETTLYYKIEQVGCFDALEGEIPASGRLNNAILAGLGDQVLCKIDFWGGDVSWLGRYSFSDFRMLTVAELRNASYTFLAGWDGDYKLLESEKVAEYVRLLADHVRWPQQDRAGLNVVMSPDGSRIMVTDYDRHVQVWDLTGAQPQPAQDAREDQA